MRPRAYLPRRGAVALACVFAAACRPAPDPIDVEGHMVRVTNQSRRDWRDVEVWVNDHYRVTSRTLAGGGTLVAPLDTFVAGFGQRFDRRRQSVRKVEVKATDSQGAAVALRWGALQGSGRLVRPSALEAYTRTTSPDPVGG